MAKFVTLFSYTSDAVKAMVHHPSDRSAAATALVQSLGGSVESFYWMQGQHDGLLIADIPDSVSAAALSAAVGSTGAITDVETHELFDTGQQAEIVAKAAQALEAYTPPN